MSKKIIIWLMAVALAMSCLSFVSGEEPENTTGGAISVPETPPLPSEETQLPPEEESEEPPKTEEQEETAEDPDALEPEENLGMDDMPYDTAPDDDPVLYVTVPQNLDFVVDPFENAGRGQVYSEMSAIENRGDSDVLLTFSDISVIFENGADIEAMRAPFDVYNYTSSVRKALYLLLDFGRADTAPLVLTDETARANPPSILLHAAGSEGSACTLSLSGIVNCDMDAGWRNGDVKISLNYFMEVIPLQEESETEAPSEEINKEYHNDE
jgi:hypothetical protein